MALPTPTASGMTHRAGDFSSLCAALDYAAQGDTGLNFFAADATMITSLSYAELRRDAMALAGRLAAAYPRHARIGLVAETTRDFVTAFIACQYAGLVPATLSLPAAFGGREAYEWQVGRMAATADLAAVMAPAELTEILTSAMADLDIPVRAMTGADLPDTSAPLAPHGEGDPAYIQFSSGSTSDPKGIVATQASVMANCSAIIQDGLKIGPTDRVVSWLPLYHDMGMVGFLMVPVCAQMSVDYLSPTAFARRPSTWLKLISAHGATITYSPSFGYELCTKRYRGEELDLSSLRTAGIGGDMVRAEALSAFSDTFAPMGFDPRAFVASYGLAEVTLAASFAPLGEGMKLDMIDSARMQTAGRAVPAAEMTRPGQTRAFVACGRPLPTLAMRIIGEAGQDLAERQVGRIQLKGPSLALGYFRAGEEIKPITGDDGWFETGDLGYWLGDQVVITGRFKDMILWNGRNIWPQDIEWVAQHVGGKNISRAAAFDTEDRDGTTRIMLLAECWSRDPEVRAALAHEIVAATRAATGAPVHVELVAVRSLPMTSSGKLSRSGARNRYLAGGFADLGADDAVAAPVAVATPNRGA